jgi:hypothetical protein
MSVTTSGDWVEDNLTAWAVDGDGDMCLFVGPEHGGTDNNYMVVLNNEQRRSLVHWLLRYTEMEAESA